MTAEASEILEKKGALTMTELTTNRGIQPATQLFNASLFANLWSEWLRDVSETTRKGYEVTIKSFLSWIAENDIKQPQREDIIDYRDFLAAPHASRKTGRPIKYTADTQARYFRGVKMFFSFLEANNLYKDITKNVRSPRTTPTEYKRDFLEKEDVIKILRNIDTRGEANKRNYALVLALVLCGFRIIEIQRANIGDIEQRGSEIRLYIQGKGHTDKDNYKKLPPELWSAITDYLAFRGKAPAEAPLFASVGTNARKGGERLTIPSISRLVKNVLKEAGYNSKRITAHSLRHTSVTLDRKAGASLEEASRHARHSSIAITQRYDHLLEKTEAKDEERIAAYLFGGTEEEGTASEILEEKTAAEDPRRAEASEILGRLDDTKLLLALNAMKLLEAEAKS